MVVVLVLMCVGARRQCARVRVCVGAAEAAGAAGAGAGSRQQVSAVRGALRCEAFCLRRVWVETRVCVCRAPCAEWGVPVRCAEGVGRRSAGAQQEARG